MEGSTDPKTDVYHHPTLEVAYEPDDELAVQKYGTERDVHDMERMGKVQSLRVRWWQLSLKQLLIYFSATSVIIRSSDSP